MICKVISFLILLNAVIGVHAQFNDSTFYQVSYGATGIVNKTKDVSSYVFSNALRFNVKRKDISVNTMNSYIYGQQQHRLTNNDFTSSLDFNLYKTFPHFYYWGLATYDKSYSLKINERYQAGFGIAYSFFDQATLFVNLSDGILYEKANLKITDSTADRYNVFRNSFRFRYKFVFGDMIVWNGSNLLQNALNGNKDYIISSINSLSLKLRKWLSLTAAANYNRVERTKRENLLLTFGLSVEKYF